MDQEQIEELKAQIKTLTDDKYRLLRELKALKSVHESSALRDVIAERQRQVSVEGWTPEHDDRHFSGDICRAATLYAEHAADQLQISHYDTYRTEPLDWPWAAEWWKPSTPRRDLEKAGALILAEIERLDRAESKEAA